MRMKLIDHRNALHILLTFGVFALMVVVTGWLITRTIKRRIVATVNENFNRLDMQIGAACSEADFVLFNADAAVREFLAASGSTPEISAFIQTYSRRLQVYQYAENNMRLLRLYGYLDGELIGMVNDTGSPIIPFLRTAQNGNGKTLFTTPIVINNDEVLISGVKGILRDGKLFGWLVLEISISGFNSQLQKTALVNEGYNLLLSPHLTVLTHPMKRYLNTQLRNLGAGYRRVADALESGIEVSEWRIPDSDGKQVIVFFRRISNGWYIGTISSYYAFYRDWFSALLILSVCGILFATLLSVIIARVNRALKIADNENRAKSSFVARISHEILTPMHTIIGMNEMVERKFPAPECQSYLVLMHNAASGLLEIINNLLDFSKLEINALKLKNGDYELAAILRYVINHAREKINHKTVQFVVKVDPALPSRYYGDAARIQQILLTLLANAIKCTEIGQITLSVAGEPLPERAETDDDKIWTLLTLTVNDTGRGIKKADLEKIGNSFSQINTYETRSLEGVGLGLTIAKDLCQLMDGELTVQSEHRRGSSFSARLPQVVIDTQPLGEIAVLASPPIAADNQQSRRKFIAPTARVLVVDDIETNLLVAESALEIYRMQIDLATNGIEAIAKIHDNDYDLVLMDYLMPQMDGLETMRRVRTLANGRYRNLPICVFTAHATMDKENFGDKDFNDYLAKPIDLDELDRIVSAWIPSAKQVEQ